MIRRISISWLLATAVVLGCDEPTENNDEQTPLFVFEHLEADEECVNPEGPPPPDQFCDQCIYDSDCDQIYQGRCREVTEEGLSCTALCAHDEDCPNGFGCETQNGEAYCVPLSGLCSCRTQNAGQIEACENMNFFGTCTGEQVCAGSSGWSSCDAPIPEAEWCDYQDNDCDGVTDETVQAPASCGGGCKCDCEFSVGPMGKEPFKTDPDALNGASIKDGVLTLDASNYTVRGLWAANAAEDTVSKVDTSTAEEIARYRTCDDPSRTALDSAGNAWVACRRGQHVQLWAGLEVNCIDSNGDGIITTSRDDNGDGSIQPDEMVSGEDDECRLLDVSLKNRGWARAAGVDANDHGWIGTWHQRRLVQIHRETGEVMHEAQLMDYPYGLAIGGDGIIWVATRSGDYDLTSYNATTGELRRHRPPNWSFSAYGISIDENGRIWQAGCCGRNNLNRFDPLTETWMQTDGLGHRARGVATDGKGNVYVALDHSNEIVQVNTNTLKEVNRVSIGSGRFPIGMALDFEGYLWTVNQHGQTASKVEPGTMNLVAEVPVGKNPYSYSDMTGYQQKTVVAPKGTYRHVFEGWEGVPTEWKFGRVVANLPPGTQVEMRIRTASDESGLSASEWGEPMSVGASDSEFAVTSPPMGRFVEVEVTLSASSAASAPPTVELVQLRGVVPDCVEVEAPPSSPCQCPVDSFAYGHEYTISRGYHTELANYVVDLPLDTAALIKDGKLQPDCSDLRIYERTYGDMVEVPHWISANECGAPDSVVYAKVGLIPANGSTQVFAVFGRDDMDSPTWTCGDLFEFCDDFDLTGLQASNWIEMGSGTLNMVPNAIETRGPKALQTTTNVMAPGRKATIRWNAQSEIGDAVGFGALNIIDKNGELKSVFDNFEGLQFECWKHDFRSVADTDGVCSRPQQANRRFANAHGDTSFYRTSITLDTKVTDHARLGLTDHKTGDVTWENFCGSKTSYPLFLRTDHQWDTTSTDQVDYVVVRKAASVEPTVTPSSGISSGEVVCMDYNGALDADGDGTPNCEDLDDDGDGDPDVVDCAPSDPAVFHNQTEECKNQVDDDCNPMTACFTSEMDGKQFVVGPMVGMKDVAAFYGYSAPVGASSNTGFEHDQAISHVVYWDPNDQEYYLVLLLSKPGNPAGGQAKVAISGATGANIVLMDDAGEGSPSLDSVTGNGNLEWAWTSQNNDGAVIGPLDRNFCVTLQWYDLDPGVQTAYLHAGTIPVEIGLPSGPLTICGEP